MTRRRWLSIVVAVALAHAAAYIAVQRADWDVSWTDQGGYQLLGRSLAETGRFTRAARGEPFAPEAIRTPAYPLFVAAVYRVAGTTHERVAAAQAIVFAALCLIAYLLGRRVAGETTGRVAALATALFSPLPYFGALVMTELWTAFAVTVALLLVVRAVQDGGRAWFAIAGVACAIAALSRPVFVLLPFFLATADLAATRFVRRRPRLDGWMLLIAAFAVTMAPWFAYNYHYFQRLTISPAGGVGRGLWEGSWQGRWDGRVQAELTLIADQEPGPDLDQRVTAFARERGAAAAPMLEYVHQWQEIRKIWTAPVDPYERALARIRADDEYRRAALRNIAANPWRFARTRLTYGAFVLWAAEIPVPYRQINALPRMAIRVMWAAQALIVLTAIAGAVALLASGRTREGALLGMALIYVTLVHLPLLTEARQSLPVIPAALVLAAAAVVRFTGRSLALEPQVHERQHL
jgi:4-amino-4-deoxy-L-arabinose transferase-like glycosyltransferase